MNATRSIKCEAQDYIRKPLDLDAIFRTISKITDRNAQPFQDVVEVMPPTWGRDEIVGSEPNIIDVLKQIGLLCESRIPVLIQGESGTGQELVAQLLHKARNADKPFVAINCSAIVPTLLESELFGHEKGAFTGAIAHKIGKMELASDGTIFFDEIGEMPLELQAKLLRALEERQFERVGGVRSIGMHARVIAATNCDLRAMVDTGKFRKDLFYRLVVSTISVPPLRERARDIPLLVNYLLHELSIECGKEVHSIENSAIELLQTNPWPGNVRELKNTLQRAIVKTRNGIVSRAAIEQSMDKSASPPHHTPQKVSQSLRDVETQHIRNVLESTGWNISHSADILEITRVTLRNKIESAGLVPPAHMHPGAKRRNAKPTPS